MQLYPAIDIKGGKCVRLMQGKFDKVTVFNDSPVDAANNWLKQGASYLHIVDLDGARSGSEYNNVIISKIIDTVKIPVQVGGGIRTMRDIEEKLDIGVSRVILGTAAINNQRFVKEAIKNYGDKIAIGVDAINGAVATNGWEKVSTITAIDLCKEMAAIGVKTIIYTDIAKDGMMSGPNIEMTSELINLVDADIIASGGISNMNDLENVKSIRASGAIIGKALYEGAIDLGKAINLYERRN